MNREYNEAMDGLRFSPAAKKRMVATLAAAQEQQQAAQPETNVRAMRGGKGRWRVAAAAAAIAVLAVGLSGVAYASGALMSVGNVMDDLFGGPPAQTKVVDEIGRPLGASATSNGVTVTADAIIGDQANYAIVFSVAKDDGTAFEGVEALDGAVLPLDFKGGPGIYIDGVTSSGGSGYFYDANPADNAIQYVVKMSVTGGGDIIGRTARVNLHDLCQYSDDSQPVIAEGTWHMKFAVAYQDTSVALPATQSFDLNGMAATLDSARISPIALTLSYTVDATMNQQDQTSGRTSKHAADEMDRFLNPSITLNMKDGSKVELDASRGAAGTHEQSGTTVCTKNIMFDQFLNVDSVASITLGGQDISLR